MQINKLFNGKQKTLLSILVYVLLFAPVLSLSLSLHFDHRYDFCWLQWQPIIYTSVEFYAK